MVPDAPAVRIVGLRRSFGPVPALDGVDLVVPTGTLTALLGPNAAGKTTLLRILATLTRPDGGEAAVAGHDVVRAPQGVRQRIGLVAHRSLLYPDLTAVENLRFYARLYGAPAGADQLRELLSAVGLWHRRHDRVRTFSRGMVQRLAFARAVLHDPPVLLLDEPHSGLDPSAAGVLDDALSALAGRGRTVLLATHDLERAHRLADRMAILHRGRLVWEGAREEVTAGELVNLFASVTKAAVPSASDCRTSAGGAEPPARPTPPRSGSGEVSVVPGSGSFAGAVSAIAWKDLLTELRAREVLPPVAVFALLVTVIFHFTLPVGAGTQLAIAPGALWVALLFGSTLGLSRALGSEVDSGGITGLLISPADRGALFVGKWLAGYFFACLVAAFVLPALVVTWALPTDHLLALAGVLALGLVGWMATGTLLGAVAVSTRAREVLLPVLLFPLVLPLVLPAVNATATVLAGGPLQELVAPLVLVAAYDLIFLVLGFLLFSYTVEG